MTPYWRKLLLPFVPFYYLGAWVIQKAYDYQIFKSEKYTHPIITIGNLNVGGTGKSPFVAYLFSKMKAQNYQISSLSRGYGRKTSGFIEVLTSHHAKTVGDEPLQFKKTFPDCTVIVDENRKRGISKLLKLTHYKSIIVLDDAFQHRKVQAGLQIVLTSYSDLYCDDILLPAGNLREPISGAKRANIILVTKCPKRLTPEDQSKIISKLVPTDKQRVFFTYIVYSDLIFGNKSSTEMYTKSLQDFSSESFHLVTGIANPKPLVAHLKSLKANFTHTNYPDHYNFTSKDISELSKHSKILTTQKDYMRLQNETTLQGKLFYLPISIGFLGKEKQFLDIVTAFVSSYQGF